MGCMTTLILASEYPDLYAACMFVDGQWDISTLTGLENQTFVYFAAEDDTNAWNGAQEVMAMDDAIDALFVTVKDELIALIRNDAAAGSQAIDLLMIAKYYERIGDHAQNIAEWVEYALTGRHKGVFLA